MRVITGMAKGKKLEPIKGDTIRPTTDKIKESIFSMIQFDIGGKTFLDLFAGSGQMGIEAISRNANKAVFVDTGRYSIEILKKNLKSVGFEDKSVVSNLDALSYLTRTNEVFDIAFLDPPYYSGEIMKVFPVLSKKMRKNGVIICESPLDEILPEVMGDFNLEKTRKYGKIKVSVYRNV